MVFIGFGGLAIRTVFVFGIAVLAPRARYFFATAHTTAQKRPPRQLRPSAIAEGYQLSFSTALFVCPYPKVMSQVLAIVYRTIATHLVKKAGLTHKTAKTGGITLILSFMGRYSSFSLNH